MMLVPVTQESPQGSSLLSSQQPAQATHTLVTSWATWRKEAKQKLGRVSAMRIFTRIPEKLRNSHAVVDNTGKAAC